MILLTGGHVGGGTSNAVLLVFAILFMAIGTADAHGYLMSPRSRNFLAHNTQDGKAGWDGGASDPKVDYNPHSLNRGGLCGDNRINRPYTFPENADGGLMPLNIQATYQQGQEITIEAVLTAHHWGHFEVKACPLARHGDAPTQECFDQFPLTFVEDLINPDSPNDPDYPGRAYLSSRSKSGPANFGDGPINGILFRQKFRLPSNLNGQIVLLQWYYRTGNSCYSPGYEKYFGTGWGASYSNLPACPDPISETLPEQFWNCAEITINSGPGASPTPPAINPPAPVPAPTIRGGSPTPPSPSSSLKSDWSTCSSSAECRVWADGTGCCTGKYSRGVGKCAPLSQGFNQETNECIVGGSGPSPPATAPLPSANPPAGAKSDWSTCSSSAECSVWANGTGCCTGKYSGGVSKCTPLSQGFNQETNECVIY